jgi:hypothetical protein
MSGHSYGMYGPVNLGFAIPPSTTSIMVNGFLRGHMIKMHTSVHVSI